MNEESASGVGRHIRPWAIGLCALVFAHGSTADVIYEFTGGASPFDPNQGIGAFETLIDEASSIAVTLTTVDIIGQDGSRASEGTNHTTNVTGTLNSLGINDATNPGGYSNEFQDFNPGEGWVIAFDVDVQLVEIDLSSQGAESEMTLSSSAFADRVLEDGQAGDTHDLGNLVVPAGTEITFLMTSATNAADVSIRINELIVRPDVPAQPTAILFTQTAPLLSSATNGTDIGSFATEAPVPRSWVYSLVPGAGDANNSDFQIVGDRLLTAADVTGQGGASLSFRAQSESAGLFVQSTFPVVVEADTDNDGLPDDWELRWAPGDLGALTGDDVSDLDADELTDLAEYRLWFDRGYDMNPASNDSDGDTLLDADEVNGLAPRPPTHPVDADTDGDGLDDAIETNTGIFVDATDTGTDPTETDTDGDTLTDDVERATGIFVNAGDPGTHPLTPDSDADGLTDATELSLGTNPLDWDSDDDTAGDGLEELVHFTSPTNPGDRPSSFFWPVAKQTFTFTNHLDVGQVLISEPFGDAVWIELLRGEQLTLAFDITGNDTGNADDLDVRIGFGGFEDTFEWEGYMNPSIDLGPPAGSTAVIRYRNGSSNYGGNLNNQVVARTEQIPATGGITGSVVNTISFSLIRSDVGYTGVLRWGDVSLEATMTPREYWCHPVWDKFHIRLLAANANDLFSVTNIRVTYDDAQAPYIRPLVLSDVTATTGPGLSFSFPTDLGSAGYELQATSDLTNPAAWTPLLSNIPAGGATNTLSTVDVPGGDLGAQQRTYRIIAP